MSGRRLPELVLVAVTIVWGGTFLVSQIALGDGGPFYLLLTRFTIGSLVLALVFRRRMSGFTRTELLGGLLIGIVTFASFALQTSGLQYIPSSKSAFLTALYVPIVPLLQLGLLGIAPRPSAWAGIAVSFTGLLVLSWGEGFSLQLGLGEWLTLGGAIMSAMQIILISRWAPLTDPLRLATAQLAVVALLSLAAVLVAAEPAPTMTTTWALAAGSLGLLGTAFAIGAMNWAQRTVSATRATIIYAMEPVWAGLFGAVAGEPMTPLILTGSALIVSGILVSELGLPRGPRRRAGRPRSGRVGAGDRDLAN